MTSPTDDTIALARAAETLRQERETFDQRKAQDRRWHVQRLAMGWMAFAALPFIAAVCGWVIFNHEDFTPATVSLAAAALLVDTLGLVGAVWRGILGKGPEPLAPVASQT